ncbi:precorrin-6y C5,15-methyltransferase (decarboxylating) subunit CbiE [Methylovirgula sp. 4M-Z18]|uniref:precorrin-6y C5,15-methyltransferase (decarboxylating) subunit CbiE n=1 Tax=Methylovirgula sp. 4M-Z18 TaxID=2293567 RepID=UPI000E2EE7EF|nr:precorrin-6y C5,15-methyltransferase (decarboxylating) subunit CbiE [Methylovirgula sp. 4M-Z18]RFB76293.1 precorrin-6y C5,15-methyltransferase (decarboxylating) subunit CbiE [Methylovirgula sp. 4M-Z18]
MTSAPQQRWLTLIGLGEDGLDGLSSAARSLLAQAELVVGGERHLALAGPLTCETLAWPSPLTDALPQILQWRGRRVCVLASGDPFFYGVGTLLGAHVGIDEMFCLPGISAFSLAAARLGWSLQNCKLLSLHGRDFTLIRPHLQRGARIIALSWDGTTPQKLCAELAARGMGQSRLSVLENMGGARERTRTFIAADGAPDDVEPLNTIALEVVAGHDARIIPPVSGLDEAFFEHDGQITKREIRALTLTALRPLPGQVLWDIGAGSGSIGIEWMLLDPANRTIAIEARSDRAARALRNAQALGVPHLHMVIGHAPEALRDLPQPDAIFIGGGMTVDGVMDAAFDALRVGGRLVINAVTLESQARLTDLHERRGGDLTHIQIAHAEPLGGFRSWRAALPVTQWVWVKP